MKLLKTTLAVVAATAVSSAVFAAGDTMVEYQWAKSSAAAEITYNGQSVLANQTIKEEIVPGHISEFKASTGVNITAISIPCVLSNNSFEADADSDLTNELDNQVVLTNTDISAKAAASDTSVQTYSSTCAASTDAGGSTTAVAADTTQDLTFGSPVDQVSYTVQAITEYATAAVGGTYTGTVTITTEAE